MHTIWTQMYRENNFLNIFIYSNNIAEITKAELKRIQISEVNEMPKKVIVKTEQDDSNVSY